MKIKMKYYRIKYDIFNSFLFYMSNCNWRKNILLLDFLRIFMFIKIILIVYKL